MLPGIASSAGASLPIGSVPSRRSFRNSGDPVIWRKPVTPSASILASTEEESAWSMTCMCILLKPGMANLPVASIDVTDGSVDTLEVGVMLTIRPLSMRMLIPGLSIPSCVSTTVTPFNRSLPETACSTIGRACLWHPESKTAEHASSIVTLSEDRDMICYFR